MKILHTADWHLGKRLESFSRHEEQVAVLEEICAIADAEDVDAVVIAGDLFDVYNPPNESIELFYKICKRLTNNGLRPVIAIAGNHDSPDRIEAPDPLARECGIIFAGFPNSIVKPFSLPSGLAVTANDEGFIELKLPRVAYPLRVLLTPFANEERLRRYLGNSDREVSLRSILSENWQQRLEFHAITEGVTILVSHLLFIRDGQTVVQEDEGEKPIYLGTASAFYPEDVPEGVQYVALGHLHRHHFVAKTRLPIAYSGSPLAYSFNEENQEKYVLLVEVEPDKKAEIRTIELKNTRKLLKITAENVQDAFDKLAAVPDALIQLSLKTETYLDRTITQPLYEFHKGIVPPIIPILAESTEGVVTRHIDFNNIENMFVDYFKFKKKQEPSEGLMRVFREIIAQNDESVEL